MQTYFRITLDSKKQASLITAIDLRLKTVRFIVENKISSQEECFDDLNAAYLNYCFIG